MTSTTESDTVPGFARRLLGLAYGLFSYAVFFGSFLYTIGFLAEQVVPNTINYGHTASPGVALAVNLGLLLAFGLQHSVMARPTFKRAMAGIVAPSQERQTYVLASAIVLFAVGLFWHPLGGEIFDLRGSAAGWALTSLQLGGFGLVLAATIAIDHFELFGLSQTFAYARGKRHEDRGFRVPTLYRFVRHPIQTGFLIASWATPHMTISHLVFAVVITAYIVVALKLEERNLVDAFGDDYRKYREQVGMLFPRGRYTGDSAQLSAASG